MQTRLSQSLLETPEGETANSILRRCVHCGFCNATCPTYQLLGDELDGPRGRIYLIKQLLEGDLAGARADSTRLHLDRCLTCRNCESTCPSGVEYNRLLDIGRERVEQVLERPWHERLMRWGLRQVIPYPKRFAWVLYWGRLFSPFLPRAQRAALPPKPAVNTLPARPQARHSRRVILFEGCVQSVLAGEINTATATVLDSLDISSLRVQGEACCGALDQHLAAPEPARAFMRANIDAWWPHIEAGAEAIVSTASACGLQIKDYGHFLQDDPVYGEKARKVSALARDIAELVVAEESRPVGRQQRVAFHAPCTLQHGQKLGGVVEGILSQWGFDPQPVENSHLCCGSAGTYSVLQPSLSGQLRDNKLASLQATEPEIIGSANIGCLLHLRAKARVPVKHWIELLAEHC